MPERGLFRFRIAVRSDVVEIAEDLARDVLTLDPAGRQLAVGHAVEAVRLEHAKVRFGDHLEKARNCAKDVGKPQARCGHVVFGQGHKTPL